MLVLSRKRDERIVINNNIVVTIIEVRGDKVRLGVEAPKDVSVHRQEVFDAINRENERVNAAKKPPVPLIPTIDIPLGDVRTRIAD